VRLLQIDRLARLALLSLLAASTAAGTDVAGARWLQLGAPAGIDRAQALAFDGATARLAVGGERGVAWGPIDGPLERVLARGPVRDLVFEPDGTLLAATDAGLYRIAGPGRVFSERIGTGEAARAVADLDSAAGWLAAATGAGVYLAEASVPEPVWRRMPELPFGEARRVLLMPGSGGDLTVWAVIDGALWRAGPDALGVRQALPLAGEGEEGPLDLVRGSRGELLVLLARSLAILAPGGGWRVEHPVLPPGAVPLRLVADPDRLWLATDAGLLTAPDAAGPWRRSGPPAGSIAVTAVAGTGDHLVVATARGLLRIVDRSGKDAGRRSPAPAPWTDPPVRQVQRQALHYLALAPSRMRELWDAAGRSALYPAVSLRGDWGRDRDHGIDDDEAFLSGAKRYLRDRDRSEGEDYGVSLELSWDLGEAVFNPERIDVSREARLVAQLRDDVLDEIDQLYFERQRVLASLAAPEPEASETALRLRAAELASGLDAWTGGWFSEQLAHRDSAGPSLPEQEPLP